MDVNNIINSINIISEKIFKSVEGEVFEKLDELLILDETILEQEPLKTLYIRGEEQGFVVLTMSFIIFFVMYYAINRLIAMYNGEVAESNIKSLFKLILCTIFSVYSIYICEQVLMINGLLTKIIAEIGKELTGEQICFISLREVIVDLDKYMASELISIDGIIKGVISFGATTILISFSIRYVTLIFLILVTPISIMLASNDITYGIFKSWGKILCINLLMQNIVIIILLIPLTIKNTNSDMFKIILVGSIYLLYKVNNFSKEFLGSISDTTRRR